MKNAIMLLVLVLMCGCAADDQPATSYDDFSQPGAPSVAPATAAPRTYPLPGYHELDVYCLADQTLNRSISFSIDSEGAFASDVLTTGHTLRLLNADGQVIWRLYVQQADRDESDCVTLLDFGALVDSAGAGHVQPGTFRRECFDDRPSAVIIDCYAAYR